jgi:hypothetical protein
MKSKSPQKLFVVRKYIRAISAAEAITKDRKAPVDDVWVEEEWKNKHLADAIGFGVDRSGDNDDDL